MGMVGHGMINPNVCRRQSGQVNSFDIITKIKEKYHTELNKPFGELGFQFGSNRTAADTRLETVVSTLRSNSRAADGFLRVVAVLAGVGSCAPDG